MLSQQTGPRAAYLVPLGADPVANDTAYLCALAAAAAQGAAPVVLAVQAEAPWRPELLDFLRRYEPTEVIALGELPPATDLRVETIVAATGGDLARALVRRAFAKASSAVVCDFADRRAGLSAGVFAARMGLPLLPFASPAAATSYQDLFGQLGVRKVYVIGARSGLHIEGVKVVELVDEVAVARELEREQRTVGYLAAVAPDDARRGHVRSSSLAGALLAAARGGALVFSPGDAHFKESHATGVEAGDPPVGAQASRAGRRQGCVDRPAGKTSFLTGIDPRSGRAFVQFDLDGDGRFDGRDEAPHHTGDEVVLAGRREAIDLDTDEGARGASLTLTAPVPRDTRAAIARVRDALRNKPDTLCLCGWPDVLPMAIVGDAQPTDADLCSDLPLAQTDDDPFADLSFARFLAEDLPSATMIACRGLVERGFRDRAYAHGFASAEWDADSRPMLEGLGMRFLGHHGGGKPITQDSPLTQAGLITHGSHAAWTVLGETAHWDSQVLLAPSCIVSSGCSTAALDMDPQHRSVALRLLRNGALAFVGNNRRGTAQQELFRTEFLNSLIDGCALGAAHRWAQNRVIVAMLARGEGRGGGLRYQLHAATVFGDPALAFELLPAPLESAARVELRGARATVHGPARWFRADYEPLAEWKCPVTKLSTWRAPGVGFESVWDGVRHRNQDTAVFTAEVVTSRRYACVEAVGSHDPAGGFDGKCFVDEHEDGTRSLFWRVPLVDFDMESGTLGEPRESAVFRLLAR